MRVRVIKKTKQNKIIEFFADIIVCRTTRLYFGQSLWQKQINLIWEGASSVLGALSLQGPGAWHLLSLFPARYAVWASV